MFLSWFFSKIRCILVDGMFGIYIYILTVCSVAGLAHSGIRVLILLFANMFFVVALFFLVCTIYSCTITNDIYDLPHAVRSA